MKNLIFICFLINLMSCSKKPTHYKGVVVDYNSVPIKNVLIREQFSDSIHTTSKKNGFFKLKKTPNSLPDLIFSKEGYITDTVRTVWSEHGELISYRFLNKKLDTLRLKK